MRLRLTLISSALALLAAACGGGQVLASVNGEEITADYMASLRADGESTLDLNSENFYDMPVAEGQDPPTFRDELSNAIIREAIRYHAKDQFDIEVTDEEIADRLADPPPRWQGLLDVGSNPFVSDVLRETQAELSILRDRIISELIREDPDFIDSMLGETPQQLTVGCVRHILVDSQLAAEAVLDRLEAGEDFIALADEVTIDSVSGSDPVGGCPAGFGGFSAPFAFAASTAPINEVVGPVETEFGFHLIRVEERIGPPTADEIREDPLAYLPGSTLSTFFTPWFNAAVRDSEIEVTESVGRWSVDGIGIIPPGQ